MITLRARLKDVKVRAAEKEFKHGDATFPAGSFVVNGDAARVRSAIEPLGLTAVALPAPPQVPLHDVNLPRLAVYSTWGGTQDVGWVRYAFDKFEVPYDLIYKEQVRRGDLKSRYDEIVVPQQVGTAKRLVFDVDSRGTPIAYKKSDQFKYLGMYGESDDITGGMGLQGVAEIDRFVNQGGVLITLGVSSFLPPDFGITRTVDAARTTPQFYAPGPIVEAEILRPTHPIFYGYTQKVLPVRWANGPLLRVTTAQQRGTVLMQFPGTDKSVLSGLMRGVSETRNRPAVIEQKVGQGNVVMFATNPAYRWQNLGEFNMLANSILHFNDYGRADVPAPTPPSAPAQ
jgi:hypothetical protein